MRYLLIILSLVSFIFAQIINKTDSLYSQTKEVISGENYNREDSIKVEIQGNTIQIGNIKLIFQMEDFANEPYIFYKPSIKIKIDSLIFDVENAKAPYKYNYIINNLNNKWKSYGGEPNINGAVFDDGRKHPEIIEIFNGLQNFYIPSSKDFKPFSFFNKEKTTIALLSGYTSPTGSFGIASLYIIDVISKKYLIKHLKYGSYPIWSEEEINKYNIIVK